MNPPPIFYQSPPPDYEKYRRRKLWKAIRERVFVRDDRKCFRCSGAAQVVHHRSYAPDVMDGLADEWLISLCHGCHTVVEIDDAGHWRSWSEKERLLHSRDTRTDFPEPVIDLRRRSTEFPLEWSRMNAIQRSAWLHRAKDLRTAKRSKRPKPIRMYFDTRDAAEEHAFKILDNNPKLVGRFRDCWEILLLAMLSQGYELLGNSHYIVCGLKPAIAKIRFDSFAAHTMRLVERSILTESDRAELDASGIWNQSKPRRMRSTKARP